MGERTTGQCIGNACLAAGRFARNTVLPAAGTATFATGRFLRNTALPAAGAATFATGRFLRNTAAPAAGTAAAAAGRFGRNYVAYPIGRMAGQAARAAFNVTRRCAGRACNRGRNAATRVRARLGRAVNFTPGLEITANDRATVEGIVGLPPREAAERITGLAEHLGHLVSDHLLDNDLEPSVEVYQEVAANDLFSGLAKGLFLLNLGQMGRPLEAPNATTVAHIVMQSNEGRAADIVFHTVTPEELVESFNALQADAAHAANANHMDGGRRKNRKSRTRKNRKSRTRKHRKQHRKH